MSRAWRATLYLIAGALIMALLILATFLFLTRTSTGVNLVARFAIERLEREIEGELQVDSVSTRRLLGGVVIHGLALTDKAGRPFVRADSARVGYRIRSFLAGQIVFDRVELYQPTVVLEKLPGDTLWNFEHIFPPGPPEPDRERKLIEIDRVSVRDGTAIIRTPLEAGADDDDRMIVREVPGGLVREIRFDEIDGNVPRIIWETPTEPGRLIEVASLSLRGFVWEDPFILDELRGAVTIRDSLITFDLPAFALPNSRGSAIGEVITGPERVRYDIRVEADDIALTDLRWLYPPLAVDGNATGTFRMQTQPVGTLYLVQNARIRAPGTNLAGNFGIVLEDTLYFTEVALRAAPLNLELLHEIIPDAPILEGLLAGTIEVEGPISALNTRGEFTLSQARSEGRPTSLRWHGTLDLDEGVGANALTLDLDDLGLELLTEFWPELALSGGLSGRLEATGRLDRGLRLNTRLSYRGGNERGSDLGATGTIQMARGGVPLIDLAIDAEEIDLASLAGLIPALEGVEGRAVGRARAQGRVDDLDISADLNADGGNLRVDGHIALIKGAPHYQFEGTLDEVLVDHLLAGRVPRETSLSASFDLSGVGIDPRRASAQIGVHVGEARFAGIGLSSLSMALRLDDGIAHLDSLIATSTIGALYAAGSLGLDDRESGTIELQVNADSVSALQAILFPDAPARFDPDSVRGRLGGSIRIDAELRGAVGALDLEGSARIRRPTIDGVEAHRVDLSFEASGIGTDSLLAYDLLARIDSLDIYGHRVDAATAHIDFSHGGGWFELEGGAEGMTQTAYHLISGFRPLPHGLEFDLRELRAHVNGEEWGLAEPALLRIGASGITIDDLLFSRTTGAGRVLARGRLPWQIDEERTSTKVEGLETADLRLEFQQLPLLPIAIGEEGQTVEIADITGAVQINGTVMAPRIEVDLRLTDLGIGGLHFESVVADLEYIDQGLGLTLEVIQDDMTVLFGAGKIPLDLRLMNIDERRLDQPLDFTLRADGVPVAVLGPVLEGFRSIEGQIDGIVTLRGTTKDPVLGGQLAVRDAGAIWIESGVRYRGVSGTAQVRGDQVVEIDLTARTTGGSATVGGTLDFQSLTDPKFDLLVLARNFQAVHRRDVEMNASGQVRLEGSFTRPEITGRVRVDRGTLYLDEVWRQYQIITLDDPLLIDVIDSTFVVDDHLLEESESEFVKNMKADVEVEIQRGSWLRSRQLNVEVSGDLRVEFNRSREDIRLTGTLNAVRGTYEFYIAEDLPARRFIVREGVVEFDGTPGVNPAFDITASYRVRTTDRQPLNVLASVTGNLENPRVNLRSEDDETLGESDLLSYLIFGRPTYALAGGEVHQLDSYLTGLGAGLVTPTVLGYWAMLSETIATNLGIADYVSITPMEADSLDFGDGGLRAFDPFTALGRAQVEVGNYLGDAWYMAVTRRFGHGVKPYDLGVRLEWRLAPTWTAEFFVEDRFARTGRLGFDQPIESRKVGGLFLFREWGF